MMKGKFMKEMCQNAIDTVIMPASLQSKLELIATDEGLVIKAKAPLTASAVQEIYNSCSEEEKQHFNNSKVVQSEPPAPAGEWKEEFKKWKLDEFDTFDDDHATHHQYGAERARNWIDKEIVQPLQKQIEELREWKRQAIKVMPDFQKIGKLLGIPLGSSVSEQIIPKIEELREENARNREVIEAQDNQLADRLDQISKLHS